MKKTSKWGPMSNYPPGISDEDIDRAWGEEQEFLSEKHIEHEIDRRMELESLRKLDEKESTSRDTYEAYGFSIEFDDEEA